MNHTRRNGCAVDAADDPRDRARRALIPWGLLVTATAECVRQLETAREEKPRHYVASSPSDYARSIAGTTTTQRNVTVVLLPYRSGGGAQWWDGLMINDDGGSLRPSVQLTLKVCSFSPYCNKLEREKNI